MSVSQRIEESNIRAVSRIIDSVSFEGSGETPEGVSRGTINVTNEYRGAIRQPDGSELYQLSMAVDVAPEEGVKYYSLSMRVSGLFQPLSDDMSVTDIEREVLTYGAQGLYGYLGEVATFLTKGGLIGELNLPMVSFSAEEE